MTNFIDPFDVPAANTGFIDPFDATTAAPPKQNKGTLGDIGTSLKRGIQQIPGMVTGVADIVPALALGARPFTKGAEYLGEQTGFQPGKWEEEAKAQYSPEYRQAQQEISDVYASPTTGAKDVAEAYIKHPGQIANVIAESLPSVVVGGGVGGAALRAGRVAAVAGERAAIPGVIERAVGKELAVPVAAGIGEGAVTAGQSMSQAQGDDQRKNAIAALGSAVVTAAIGAGAGRLVNKMGLETVDTALVRGFDDSIRGQLSLGRRVAGGAAAEGLLQELPQSAQEQVWSNWAAGRPLWEGVPRAAVEGALAGFAMGGATNISGGKKIEPVVASEPIAEPTVESGPTLGLPNYPNQPMIVYPDGSTGTQADFDAHINGLPESERAAARAELLGMGSPAAPTLALPDYSQYPTKYSPERIISFPNGESGTVAQLDKYINTLGKNLPPEQANVLRATVRAKLLGMGQETSAPVVEPPPLTGGLLTHASAMHAATKFGEFAATENLIATERADVEQRRAALLDQQAQRREGKLESIGARIAGEQQAAVVAARQAIIDNAYDTATNPPEKILADMQRAYPNSPLTPQEKAQIAKREHSREGLAKEYSPLPSAPNELVPYSEPAAIAHVVPSSRITVLKKASERKGNRVTDVGIVDRNGVMVHKFKQGEREQFTVVPPDKYAHLDDVMVTASVQNDKTGRSHNVKISAAIALQVHDDKITMLNKLLKCVK